MSANDKSPINIDIDGYSRAGVDAEEDLRKRYSDPRIVYSRLASHPDSSVRDLVAQYYWQTRSSLVVIEDQIDDKENTLKVLKSWQQSALGLAVSLTEYQLHYNFVPEPDWVDILKAEHLEQITQEFPDAQKIGLEISMEPRFGARALPGGAIKIYSHVYAFLKALNSSLLLVTTNLLDDQGRLSNDTSFDVTQLGRRSVPQYVFLHDCISPAVLPYTSYPSMDIYSETTKLTRLQVNLIIAHEYAHFALGHINHPARTSVEREQQEEEADMFALRTCFRIVEAHDYYQLYHLWNAYRFLYQYQIISEVISLLLRGKAIDEHSVNFENRRSHLLREFAQKMASDDFGNTIEIAGTLALLELKNKLIEIGTKTIKEIADVLEKAPTQGEVEPWWKKLQTNKR